MIRGSSHQKLEQTFPVRSSGWSQSLCCCYPQTPAMPSATKHSSKGKARATPLKTDGTLPMGKQLASADKRVRDNAISNLAAFLSRSNEPEGSSSAVLLSDSEMAKLWKGIFYCFWMSDKPLVQQALAAELANLLLIINPIPSTTTLTTAEADAERTKAALAFLDGFWKAMVREWSGLDRLRMDKYYMLIRKYVNATFRLLARTGWSKEVIEEVNQMLLVNGGVMTYENPRVPASLAYHLSDIVLEELDKVLGLPDVEEGPVCPVADLLQPFTILCARTNNTITHKRMLASVHTPLLSSLAASIRASEMSEEAEGTVSYPHLGQSQPQEVRKAVLSAVFSTAADERATEVNRRRLYQFWKEHGGDNDD